VVPQVALWQSRTVVDELTLARARRGDAAAQTELVRQHETKVFALLGRMLGRASPQIEDLAQETFLKALRALPSFDPAGSATLSTWILTIATRLAIDAMRRDKRWATEEEVERTDLGAIERLEQRDLAAHVEAALGDITPEGRAILVLRAHHDLDYPEIAKALGLEPGTAKSRLSRARAALKKALSARGIEVES
jgi:RNA polymerase sigma-70 factor (ECF subfamily)